MKVSMTLHEIYTKLKYLREQRDNYARIIADCLAENEENEANHFVEKFKHINDVIEYYSQIDVEFDNKFATEDE